MRFLTAIILLNFVLPDTSAFETPISGAVAAHNDFAMDLFREMLQRDGNVCLSPPAVFFPLATCCAGSAGTTRRQLARALHLDDQHRATVSARQPERFRADRPFLYLIRDHHTGLILFIGRFVEPAGRTHATVD